MAAVRTPRTVAMFVAGLTACLAMSVPAAASASSTDGIAFSLTPTRAQPKPLAGQRLSATRSIYVFLPHAGLAIGGSVSSVASVSWYIDDPTMAKPPWNVERNGTRAYAHPPEFDLNGSRRAGTLAIPFNLGSVADVTHTITVAVVSRTGKVKVVSAQFGVLASGKAYTDEVFDDEFGGSAVNLANWALYDGPGNAGFGLRRPSAVTVGHRNLVITATDVNGQTVTGGLQTIPTFLYAQYQFRVKTESDPSTVTSGVVLLYPKSNVYAQGEEDMYETLRTRNSVFTFLHALQRQTTPTVQDYNKQPINATHWTAETVDVTRSAITIYRNGRRVLRDTNPKVIPRTPHVFCIQLDPALTAPVNTPVHMDISYVRIYQ